MTDLKHWSGVWLRARGGRPVASDVAGNADASTTNTRSTRSQAGSISKQLVAVAVLQLVEQNAFGLADTAGDLLRDRDATWRDATVHQLLTHSAGLGHWDDLPGVEIADPPAHDELARMIARTPLVHEPGAGFAYSALGYLLVAAIVEAATGTTYPERVTRHVLQPAGMTESISGEYVVGRPGVAHGHRDGEPVALSPRLSELPGTGDLWTTTGDLLKFARALHGGQLVSAATLELIGTPHVTIPSEPGPLEVRGYGYGTFVGSINGGRALFHPGDNPGYKSLLAHLPDTDEDIAVLSNDGNLSLPDMVELAVAST